MLRGSGSTMGLHYEDAASGWRRGGALSAEASDGLNARRRLTWRSIRNYLNFSDGSPMASGSKISPMKTLIAVGLSLPLLFACQSRAQISAAQGLGTNFDAALGQLAFQIAGPLEKDGVKRVIVADLLDPNGRSHPVGRFLANRLSSMLRHDFPALETID